MATSRDIVRLREMLAAARRAVEFVRGRKRADLDEDEMLALALARLLEIIGEAAKTISEDLRNRYPGIPWSPIARTRDRLAHGYFDVDLNIVWTIVTADLPPLIKELNRAIASEGTSK